MKKSDSEIDKKEVNELVHLSSKLLKLTYIITILGIIFIGLIVFKQLKLYDLLFGILKVISPLFIGFIISWLFYPLYKYFLSKGMNKVVSSVLVFLIIISVIVLIIYIFIPVLYNQVNELISYIPNILTKVTSTLQKTLNHLNLKGIDTSSMKDNLIDAGQNYIVKFTTSLPTNIINVVKGLFSAVGTILVSLIISIYMLIDFDNVTEYFYNLFPKKNRDEVRKLFSDIGTNARKVVNGTLLVAFVVFILDTIGFFFLGLQSSVLFGLLCGITDLIPYIGPYIGGAAAVIVGFTQSPVVGIGVLIIAVIVQFLESYILQPMIMSKAMQLNPILIIIGLLIFGYLFGIIGMIIATPCLAIIKEIYLFTKRKIKERKA